MLYKNKTIDVCETLMPPFPNLSRIGFTFDLDLSPTDLDIDRVIYSSRTIYLPRLKLLGQSALELSVAQGVGD